MAAFYDGDRAFGHAWPGQSQRFKTETIERKIADLLKMTTIKKAIAFYRQDMEGGDAQSRLDWNKSKRATEEHARLLRTGSGLVEVVTIIDRGTPELRDKQKKDVIGKLRASGTLTETQIWAAREIRVVVEAGHLGKFSTNRAMDGTRVDHSWGVFFPAKMSSEVQEKFSNRYEPWIAVVGSQWIASGKRRITVGDLVYEIVINNRGPRLIESEYRMKHGRATEILSDALWRYAVIAGWEKPK